MVTINDHMTGSGPGFFNQAGFFSHAGFVQARRGNGAAGASVEEMGASGRVSIVAASLFYYGALAILLGRRAARKRGNDEKRNELFRLLSAWLICPVTNLVSVI
jgi:hypothetical protein